MVELRTYKTGLRAPQTLLAGLAALVRGRQVLRFLEVHGDAGFGKFLEDTSCLSNAPRDVKEGYERLYNRWKCCSKREIEGAL